MKKARNWFLIFIVIMIVFGFWYNWKYSMEVANNYTVNSPLIENKLLIATQQSEYKDKVTHHITDRFIGKDLYISVIDVTELDEVEISDFQHFVIIHTVQMWEPPKEVMSFLRNKELKNRTFIISTSGQGDILTDGIDGISSASIVLDAEKDASKAISWIDNQFRIGI